MRIRPTIHLPLHAPQDPPVGCGVVASRLSIPGIGWRSRGLRADKQWKFTRAEDSSTYIGSIVFVPKPESH
jgi:hypothetical protein